MLLHTGLAVFYYHEFILIFSFDIILKLIPKLDPPDFYFFFLNCLLP